MTDDITGRNCDHCGSEIQSNGRGREIGENVVHKRCVGEYVDATPKMELTSFTCDTCHRSFWTETGLERHNERNVCVV